MTADKKAVATPRTDRLRAILCDPEGTPCFVGNDDDRREAQLALQDLDRCERELAAAQEAMKIETCNLGHRFYFMEDHPKKDGAKRCPHCMVMGLDDAREALKKAEASAWNEVIETAAMVCDSKSQYAYDLAEMCARSIRALRRDDQKEPT